MSLSTSTTLRRATRADLPRMTRILIDAFAQGPWDRYVCPPHLRVKPGDSDVFDWRMHTLSSTLESPGRDTILACRGAETEGEEIVGWAQWLDLGAGTRVGGTIPEEARAMMERELGPSAAAIDKEALSRLRREGLQLEESFEEFLGAERSKVSWRECNHKERSLDILGRDEARVSMPNYKRPADSSNPHRSNLPGHRPKKPAGRDWQASSQGRSRQSGGPGKRCVPASDARGPPALSGLGVRASPRAESHRGEPVCYGVEGL